MSSTIDRVDLPWVDEGPNAVIVPQPWSSMDKDSVKACIQAAGIALTDESRNGNDTGWCLRTDAGAIVNVFDTGKLNIQGKSQDRVRQALGIDESGGAAKHGGQRPAHKTVQTLRKVFVVYGHDDTARTELEAMLRRWNLEPLILDQLPSGGQTIIEKLESIRSEATFAVVLATPDDEGHKRGHPDEMAFRARQNVVLELGMMLAILGRPKVAIILKSDPKMERPSDIQGLIYIPYKESINETKLTLAQEMHNQGLTIDLGRV